MKKFIRIIRWIVRIIFGLWIWLCWGANFSQPFLYILIGELFATAVSLVRYDEDSVREVVLGFIGDEDYGYYEYTDKTSLRLFGWLGAIAAFLLRLCEYAMVAYLLLSLINPELAESIMSSIPLAEETTTTFINSFTSTTL